MMPQTNWIERTSPALQLMMATSWVAPESWRTRQDEAIRQACRAGPDWTEYLYLVDRHRTPALSWAALKRVQNIAIPELAAKELRKRSDTCRMQSMLHLQLLAAVLKAFNQAGIPVMPLKGPLLSRLIYGDPGIRQSKDLDILVPPELLQRAQASLEELGWVCETDVSALTPRQLDFKLRHEQHFSFVHSIRDCQIELHWRFGGDTPALTESRMKKSLSSKWGESFYQALSPVDLTLFLCVHGTIHAWSRAKWLGDLARIYASGFVDWDAVLEKARSVDQETPVLLCLRLLEQAYDLPATGSANRWETVPSVLIDKAVGDLTAFTDPAQRGIVTMAVSQIRSFRCNRLLNPKRPWRERFAGIAVCSDDFRVIRLPDWLFWLYVPLRPLLWARRKLMHFLETRSLQEDRFRRRDRALAPAAPVTFKSDSSGGA